MEIHIGQKIREKVKELRIGPTELSKMINTSKQNIYGIYKRRSIDTHLLSKISKALNHNFFKHYFSDEALMEVAEPVGEYKSGKKEPMAILQKEVEMLHKELNELKDKIELLKKINVLLEKEKEK
mgnify:CR=1 FL=1